MVSRTSESEPSSCFIEVTQSDGQLLRVTCRRSQADSNGPQWAYVVFAASQTPLRYVEVVPELGDNALHGYGVVHLRGLSTQQAQAPVLADSTDGSPIIRNSVVETNRALGMLHNEVPGVVTLFVDGAMAQGSGKVCSIETIGLWCGLHAQVPELTVTVASKACPRSYGAIV